MKTTLALSILALLVPAAFADQITLTASPGFTDTGSITVSVAGLSDVLSAYDLTITFDPAILSIQDVLFGSELGNPFGSATNVFPDTPQAGSVEVTEVTFLGDDILANNQDTDFDLFTIDFNVLANGSTHLDFDLSNPDGGLFGAGGLPIGSVDATGVDVTASVTPAVVTAPEPSTFVFGLLATAALAGMAKKRSNF